MHQLRVYRLRFRQRFLSTTNEGVNQKAVKHERITMHALHSSDRNNLLICFLCLPHLATSDEQKADLAQTTKKSHKTNRQRFSLVVTRWPRST